MWLSYRVETSLRRSTSPGHAPCTVTSLTHEVGSAEVAVRRLPLWHYIPQLESTRKVIKTVQCGSALVNCTPTQKRGTGGADRNRHGKGW